MTMPPEKYEASRAVFLLLVLLALVGAPTQAQVATDEPAAVVVYPYVVVDGEAGKDTLIRLNNTSADPVLVRCRYEDILPQCVGGQPQESCLPGRPACSGYCERYANQREFSVRLTSRQPLAWWAREGVSEFPLDGISRQGPGGASNQGSLVPPVREEPFAGALRCAAFEENGRPSERNVLAGAATIETRRVDPLPAVDAARYRAVGIPVIDGMSNGDTALLLGGPTAEYAACPEKILLQHFFDGATLRIMRGEAPHVWRVGTTLFLASCGSDYGGPPVTTTVDVEVWNEFEQRLATSLHLVLPAAVPLSLADTGTPELSVFHVATQGTLAGHSLLRVRTGDPAILALAIERYEDPLDPGGGASAAVETLPIGQRQVSEVLLFGDPQPTPSPTATVTIFPSGTPTVPTATATPKATSAAKCVGDCDGDGEVAVDEIVTAVDVALGTVTVDQCEAIDVNRDGHTTVDEVVFAVTNALQGCP